MCNLYNKMSPFGILLAGVAFVIIRAVLLSREQTRTSCASLSD